MRALTRLVFATMAVLAFPTVAIAADDADKPRPVWVSADIRATQVSEMSMAVQPEPSNPVTAKIKMTMAEKTRTAIVKANPAVKAPRTYTLRPVTAFGSQATVDRGVLVTWMTRPTCLLAGHDNRGWAWLDNVPTGSIVNVKTGPCAGRYKVTGHKWQARKGGPVPSWMGRYDLVLQTCTGRTGMGFSVAQKV